MIATTAAAAAAGASPTSARPWLASYPPGVPATIDEAALITLAAMFRDSVRTYAERPAVESFGKRMSYAELGTAADAVASWLQAQGLKRGDRVAIMLPNVMAYPAILHGVL
ncbi:MAG: AMP-binding protein, partial [Microvirga sp.]